MRVAIMGSGNGGTAAAFEWAQAGHDVSMWDFERFDENIAAIAASGHIAGVINPPAAKKYCYWFTDKKPPANPDEWLAHATQKDGSWWPDWDQWVKKQSGSEMVPAREPGTGSLPAIEDAPGPYVSMKA